MVFIDCTIPTTKQERSVFEESFQSRLGTGSQQNRQDSKTERFPTIPLHNGSARSSDQEQLQSPVLELWINWIIQRWNAMLCGMAVGYLRMRVHERSRTSTANGYRGANQGDIWKHHIHLRSSTYGSGDSSLHHQRKVVVNPKGTQKAF